MAKHLRVGMVAGEASGDLLASHLIAALKSRRPSIEFAGIGGPRMSAEGFESHFPMDKLSVRGYAEALRHYREIMGIRRNLAKGMLRERPDLFIGVDSSDFNLGLERQLKDAGIPTIHYVSPAVWAWRRWRVRRIARSVNRILARAGKGRGALGTAAALEQADRRAPARQPPLRAALHGERLRPRRAPLPPGSARSAFRLPDGDARDARALRARGPRESAD
jgi:hypothetical protein